MQTWTDCAQALRGLGDKVESLARRTAAMAVTAQGDGTWLVGPGMRPSATPGSGSTRALRRRWSGWRAGRLERARFEATGTGLNTCQQGAQLAQMDRAVARTARPRRGRAALQGLAPSQPYGSAGHRPVRGELDLRQFPHARLRRHGDRGARPDAAARAAAGDRRGDRGHASADPAAARATGLAAGTPVSLGYVDMVMTALGAGVHTGDARRRLHGDRLDRRALAARSGSRR